MARLKKNRHISASDIESGRCRKDGKPLSEALKDEPVKVKISDLKTSGGLVIDPPVESTTVFDADGNMENK